MRTFEEMTPEQGVKAAKILMYIVHDVLTDEQLAITPPGYQKPLGSLLIERLRGKSGEMLTPTNE